MEEDNSVKRSSIWSTSGVAMPGLIDIQLISNHNQPSNVNRLNNIQNQENVYQNESVITMNTLPGLDGTLAALLRPSNFQQQQSSQQLQLAIADSSNIYVSLTGDTSIANLNSANNGGHVISIPLVFGNDLNQTPADVLQGIPVCSAVPEPTPALPSYGAYIQNLVGNAPELPSSFVQPVSSLPMLTSSISSSVADLLTNAELVTAAVDESNVNSYKTIYLTTDSLNGSSLIGYQQAQNQPIRSQQINFQSLIGQNCPQLKPAVSVGGVANSGNCEIVTLGSAGPAELQLSDSIWQQSGHQTNSLEGQGSRLMISQSTSDQIFVPKPYDINEHWCDDCQKTYTTECNEHKLQSVNDKPVLSRAWASLPHILQIYQLSESTNSQESELGVFAKKAIPKRTRFGPFIARTVSQLNEEKTNKFIVMVDRADSDPVYLDATDESQCNWMMFVRPAGFSSEQNLVAYQCGEDVYFITTRSIPAKQELKVWYASHYARRLGIPLLETVQSESKDKAEIEWTCDQCNEIFESRSLLEQHSTSVHSMSADGLSASSVTNTHSENKESSGSTAQILGNTVENCQANAGVLETDVSNSCKSASKMESWKKRTKRQFMDKQVKLRHLSPVQRSIRVLARKSALGAVVSATDNDVCNGGYTEFKCTNCELVFDSSALLDLHMITHEDESVHCKNTSTDILRELDLCLDEEVVMQTESEIQSMNICSQNQQQLLHSSLQLLQPTSQLSTSNTQQGLELLQSSSQLQPSCQLTQPAMQHNSQLMQQCLQQPQLQIGHEQQLQHNTQLLQMAPPHTQQLSITDLFGSGSSRHSCPACEMTFMTLKQLAAHVTTHAVCSRKLYNTRQASSLPFRCSRCSKTFISKDRLIRHSMCHISENFKPFRCSDCGVRFMNNSALGVHKKKHRAGDYYKCLICTLAFNKIQLLRAHAQSHAVNGVFSCAECHRSYNKYSLIRRHMRLNHSAKPLVCKVCSKTFPRADKMRLHMLCHSSHREFMCDLCGRQFKRKDKLKDHVKRLHLSGKDGRDDAKNGKKGAVPGKASLLGKPADQPQSDYNSYVYKCHTCLLGFKRRGMLVNHLVNRHPGVPLDSVVELNLPIVRCHRDYFCQYCDKIYKSNSKRKLHIMKMHPGAELPAGSHKHESSGGGADGYGGKGQVSNPNPTFSVPAGNVTSVPHSCTLCHRQYATRSKLLQHQRSKHKMNVPARGAAKQEPCEVVERCMVDECQIMLVDGDMTTIRESDLLTQAMNELTQSLCYRAIPPSPIRVIASDSHDYDSLIPAPHLSGSTSLLPGSADSLYMQYQQAQDVLIKAPVGRNRSAVRDTKNLNNAVLSRSWDSIETFKQYQ